MALWSVSNNISFGIYEEGKTLRDPKVGETREPGLLPIQLAVNNQATVSVISGNLPPGLRIIGTTIQGTPLEVARETEFKFVLRARLNTEIDDRTFRITVVGADRPEWITPSGLLPIGNNNVFYILDSSPIDFQLEAIDRDIAAGQQLEYFIASGDGELPPGIKLTTDGRIRGVVDPVLALDRLAAQGFYDDNPFDAFPYDFGIRPANGYDSFFYDVGFYDISVPTRAPKKLNRKYQFRVSVSDGDTIEKRLFQIFVVGDDFFRADNTIMQTGNEMFSADNTFVRTPVWLTPGNLGFRRANNYVTLFLDVFDANTISGFLGYNLEDFNDDGSPSITPPGLLLDGNTGELAGVVPYQPSVTREYKFTVRATRYTGPDNRTPITIKIFETVNSGSTGTMSIGGELREITDVKIYKNSNLSALLNQTFTIKGTTYRIIRVNDSNLSHDVIRLSKPLASFLAKDSEYTDNILLGATTLNVADKRKTFTVKLLGEVDSTITWLSDSKLGTINANLTSVFSIVAKTSVPDAILRYSLISGRLPPGLRLALDGEVFGKVQQFGENYYRSIWKAGRSYNANDIVKVGNEKYKCLITHISAGTFLQDAAKWEDYNFAVSGLTVFDTSEVTFDGDTTSIDRSYTFTARAEDRFGFSAVTKTFTIVVNDPDDFTYSNLFVKPFLKQDQKFIYNSFISDPIVFDPRVIYRPNDTEFGVQPQVKMLVYAGIETTDIAQYIAASAKNHRRKTFKFGQVKTAVAKIPGTNDIVYEVVYVEVIDPADSSNGTVRNSINIKTKNPRLINDTEYDLRNNSFSSVDPANNRFRPITNSIKIDSDALQISENLQNKKYISNLTNMRNNLSAVGVSDVNFLPLWMRTPQENNIEALGYIPAVVLAYCKPGTGESLLLNVKNSNFDFTQINFDVDRYILDSSKGNSNEQYILFANYDFNV
jgi:hypothetical protein